MTEQTYTVKEVSQMMRCHPLTVIRWIKAGKLVGVKGGKVDGRGHWRIPRAELDRLMGVVAHEVAIEPIRLSDGRYVDMVTGNDID